jgi:hypothetical protein
MPEVGDKEKRRKLAFAARQVARQGLSDAHSCVSLIPDYLGLMGATLSVDAAHRPILAMGSRGKTAGAMSRRT